MRGGEQGAGQEFSQNETRIRISWVGGAARSVKIIIFCYRYLLLIFRLYYIIGGWGGESFVTPNREIVSFRSCVRAKRGEAKLRGRVRHG